MPFSEPTLSFPSQPLEYTRSTRARSPTSLTISWSAPMMGSWDALSTIAECTGEPPASVNDCELGYDTALPDALALSSPGWSSSSATSSSRSSSARSSVSYFPARSRPFPQPPAIKLRKARAELLTRLPWSRSAALLCSLPDTAHTHPGMLWRAPVEFLPLHQDEQPGHHRAWRARPSRMMLVETVQERMDVELDVDLDVVGLAILDAVEQSFDLSLASDASTAEVEVEVEVEAGPTSATRRFCVWRLFKLQSPLVRSAGSLQQGRRSRSSWF